MGLKDDKHFISFRDCVHMCLGLKSEICQCGFLAIGSLSPGHIVRRLTFSPSEASISPSSRYCYANNSKYERCDSAHAAIAAVAVAGRQHHDAGGRTTTCKNPFYDVIKWSSIDDVTREKAKFVKTKLGAWIQSYFASQ